jgi:SAM-dependent methyltransferase
VNPDDVANEVERSRRTYDSYEDRGLYDTDWAAFDEAEAAYRSRQALTLATLMREAGFRDLRALRILDVGCGRGRQVRGFVDMGADPADIQGIDVHEPSLAVARSLAPQLTFSLFDGCTIPTPADSFDLVTQHVVFSSIALPELRRHLAGEMVRVLRPGGYVFWWDTLRLSRFADATQPHLEVGGLFGALPRSELRIGQKPTLGESVRLPRQARAVRGILDRLPVVNYPTTHAAALIGPKP